MEEDQAPLGGEGFRENRAAIFNVRLSEGRELLQQMELKFMGDFYTNQRDFHNQMELFKWMEEQQVAWALERECMESEVMKLRLEVQRLRALSTSPQVSDSNHVSKEIDLKVSVERGWISVRRKALAPTTPEAVRVHMASVKLGVGKENMYRTSPSPMSSHLNCPSTLGILPRLVAEVVTSKAKNKRGRGLDALFEGKSEQLADLFEIPTAKNKVAGGLDAGLKDKAHNSRTCTAIVGKKTKPLDPSRKPPFKFVESVRKKAERENLQGTACKLCTKFYDAVVVGNAQGMVESRCNHLQNSRHRFRDLPPATLEGFWNIGFDTEF